MKGEGKDGLVREPGTRRSTGRHDRLRSRVRQIRTPTSSRACLREYFRNPSRVREEGFRVAPAFGGEACRPRAGDPARRVHRTCSAKRQHERGRFRSFDARSVLPAPTVPGRPFWSAALSDFGDNSRRWRPIRIFVMPSTAAPCTNMSSACAQMRYPGSEWSRRRHSRTTSHDATTHGCARTEPVPLRLRIRKQTLPNRTIASGYAMTKPTAPRRFSDHATSMLYSQSQCAKANRLEPSAYLLSRVHRAAQDAVAQQHRSNAADPARPR